MNEVALRLIDAICEAYDAYHVPKDVDGKPGLETFCNLAVNYVCSRMGYEKFKGMVANQIVDYMKRKPEEWEPVKMADAQAFANDGRLLLAGAQEAPHGHVTVLRPGIEEYSGKWSAKVPKTVDVGGGSEIGKSLAYAFGGPKPPEIWMLRHAPSLPVA